MGSTQWVWPQGLRVKIGQGPEVPDRIGRKGHFVGFRVPRYKTSTFGQTDTWEGARNDLSDFRIQFQGMGDDG